MYVIIKDVCISCAICKPLCPVDAIIESDGAYKIEVDECNECGICEPVCPVDAVVEI